MTLLWISLSFLAGILLASLASLPAWTWILLTAFAILLSFILRNIHLFKLHPEYLVILPAFFFGAWRYQIQQPDIDASHVAFYNDRNYELLITGQIDEAPDYRDSYTNLKIKVTAVDSGSGDLPVSGLVLARVQENVNYEYGQVLRVRGVLKTPPENEDFSYRDYLAREGIHSYMSTAEVTMLPGNEGNLFFKAVYKFKERSIALIYRLFNDPEASLLAGILLGVDTGLTKEVQQAFKDTGTAHIIAISGFNIAIIAGVFLSMFRSLYGERTGSLIAIFGIFVYTLLVGAEAAVVRAAIMGSLTMFARLIGRKQWALNSLLGVAMLMCIGNPLFVWDVGFQLSFFATLGLIVYAEPFSVFTANILSRFSNGNINTLTRIVNDNIVLTFAAQLTTIPIMAYHFQRISLISLIANPFIIPVQPAVMILSGLALLVSHVTFSVGQLLAWIAWPFATYTVRIVELFDRVPHGVIYTGNSSIWWMIGTYAALLAVTLNWPAIKNWFNSLSSSLRAAALTGTFLSMFICMVLVWRASASTGDGKLHVTFLDVGSATAVLIQTPEGRNVLINGGPSTTELSDELGRRLPFFSRRLDWLIIASTNENDLSSLPRVMERYPPDNVLWSGNIQASFSSQTLDQYFAEQGIPVTPAETGQKLELGDGAFIEVQAEGPRGSVLFLQYENFRMLLPIGVSDEAYESIEYGNVIDTVDVLLLADAGYAPSNPPDLIENLNPRLVILSVSAGDPEGLPSQDVLDSLDGYSFLRTDRNGWITVSTDGYEMQVEAERGQ